MNPIVSTTPTRVREYTRMNPLKFHGSKVEDDPQEFIVEVYKVLMIIRVYLSIETCCSNLVQQTERIETKNVGALDWEKCKASFLDRLVFLEIREEMVLEFINIC